MKTNKLKFKYIKSDLNGGNHWVARNFKVVKYQYPDLHYSAYHAIKRFKDGSYQFGDSCFCDANGDSVKYKTKKEAFNACEIYLNKSEKRFSYVS